MLALLRPALFESATGRGCFGDNPCSWCKQLESAAAAAAGAALARVLLSAALLLLLLLLLTAGKWLRLLLAAAGRPHACSLIVCIMWVITCIWSTELRQSWHTLLSEIEAEQQRAPSLNRQITGGISAYMNQYKVVRCMKLSRTLPSWCWQTPQLSLSLLLYRCCEVIAAGSIQEVRQVNCFY